jgi:glycosyltransferase involved in cell wall biosynthesis
VSEHDPDTWPTVSVIVPVLNEALHLEAAVDAILGQEYPLPFDICLAIGPSTDQTEAIAAAIAAREPRVSVVPNPTGRTPAALNRAIAATTGEIVVRVDGHAALSPGYIRRAVETMSRTGAVNVGGVQRAIGRTPFQHAVAAAMTSVAGTGGARFHVGGQEGPVDTVYLGVFRRSALAAVGCYDERLIRNQDYELNIRLRAAGGTIWFDPTLWVDYLPRSTVRSLARQYLQYGRWKRAVLRLHPSSMKLRQAAPVVVTLGVAAGILTAPFAPLALVLPLGYGVLVATASLLADRRRAALVMVALVAMHLSWGVGFLTARPRRLLGDLVA